MYYLSASPRLRLSLDATISIFFQFVFLSQEFVFLSQESIPLSQEFVFLSQESIPLSQEFVFLFLKS